MALTLAEKLIADAASRSSVVPGEIVTCRVDLVMMHSVAAAAVAGRIVDPREFLQ